MPIDELRLTRAWRRSSPRPMLEEMPATRDGLEGWVRRDPAATPAERVDRPAPGTAAEEALRADPAGLYAQCVLATRDRYRAAALEVARWSSRTEAEVASRAVDLAGAGAAAATIAGGVGLAAGSAHVGFYLLGRGRATLEASLAARPPVRVRLARRLGTRAVALYLVGVSALSLIMTGALLFSQGAAQVLILALLAGPAGFAAFWQIAQLAADTAHSLTAARPPLPRLDFATGVPEACRTLVVVPCLLRSTGEVDRLVRVLHEHAASAPGPGLRSCLLGDFGDAPREVMPDDAEILSRARSAIASLNGAAHDSPDRRFLLLHRPRRWNPAEKVWMGHERKRGKLCDLNRVILGADPGAFLPTSDAALLGDVRFVITLDADNRMADGTARRLIETLAHPLNRAEPGAAGEPLRHGYGVLQPRIASNPLGEQASRYERWAAVDLGTEEPPDKLNHLQQDLLGEASYFGKGIYDVAAFSLATSARFEENTILSHDLPEGCLARTAMVGDACVLESSPADYRSEVGRRHRWMRGDWQNLLWMIRRLRTGQVDPSATGAQGLSLLSRWKIVENVRRSLLSVAVLWLLVVGFFLAPDPALWTGCVLSVLVVPRASSAAWDWRKLWQRATARRIGPVDFLVDSARLVRRTAMRITLAAAVVPFDALLAADAALRSSWRYLLRRRGLLEWVPFDGAPGRETSTLGSYVSLMRVQLLAASGLTALLAAIRPHALSAAAPLLVAWLAGPLVAWWISRPRRAIAAASRPAAR